MKSRLGYAFGIGLILILLLAPMIANAGPPIISYHPPESGSRSGAPGQTVTYQLRLYNAASPYDGDSYNITTRSSTSWPVNVTPSSPITPPANPGFTLMSVTVTIPAGAAVGTTSTTTVTATSTLNAANRTAITLTTSVVSPTPTPTVTLTPEPSICTDDYEYDDDPDNAKRIELNISQQHKICPVDDHDWMVFGALSGKVYTIDIPEAAAGLDPSLTLYDPSGKMVAFNDDYPRDGNTLDLKPRIDSWRAPFNGSFLIKVRDAAARGNAQFTYSIIINAESYGPTPTLIPEWCMDLFEPDGLPEQARLIVNDEIQPEHRLCPTGDADWVKFFGKTGKTYRLTTTPASGLTIGADPVMVLADRDGLSIIDFNDDFGGGAFPQITFTPRVDGFYYVQVKNIGDIGGQWIGYTLNLTVASFGATATVPEPTEEPTPTGEPTEEPTPTEEDPETLAKLPVRNLSSASFVDQAFKENWQRSDSPVAGNKASRSWMWGPGPLMARAEVYEQSPGGLRQVQYFDKSRMEIGDHNADRASQWFVTNGLLVKELIQGLVQLGDSGYAQSSPAQIVIAGDLDDANGPTYASFNGVLMRSGDRSGQLVAESLSREGKVSSYGGAARPETTLVTYVQETGHNIPQVFWEFMNQRGPVLEKGKIVDGTVVDWLFAMGYPISEPYWAQVRVAGVTRWVLVQAYERRVLTYTPENPATWRVEMGNVGLHYYFWRYGVLPR